MLHITNSLCGNSLADCEFHAQLLLTQSFDGFSNVNPNKHWDKNSRVLGEMRKDGNFPWNYVDDHYLPLASFRSIKLYQYPDRFPMRVLFHNLHLSRDSDTDMDLWLVALNRFFCILHPMGSYFCVQSIPGHHFFIYCCSYHGIVACTNIVLINTRRMWRYIFEFLLQVSNRW